MSALNRAVDTIDAFNKADWDRFMDLAGDMVYNEAATGRSLQHDEYLNALKGWRAAFSDLTGEIVNSAESDGAALLEVIWRGTHDGPLVSPDGEIPPSGGTMTAPAALIYQCEGDTLTSVNHYFDMMAVLRAAGVA